MFCTVDRENFTIKNFSPVAAGKIKRVKISYVKKSYENFPIYGILYCYVTDNVNKQIGFHGNGPPSRKQRPLIKTALNGGCHGK